MAGEGYKIAQMMIACFMILGLASLALMASGKADVVTLNDFYTGLGTLAAMFGLPAIITAWVITRGQTGNGQTSNVANGTIPKQG
jgi:hypothetical protein